MKGSNLPIFSFLWVKGHYSKTVINDISERSCRVPLLAGVSCPKGDVRWS